MTDKELRRLNRGELLKLLLAETEENEMLRQKLSQAEKKLNDRTIALNDAGSIAQAALALNGVFQAAEDAAQQYLESVRQMTGRQDEICRKMHAEAEEKAAKILAEAKVESEKIRADADEYSARTRAETEDYCAQLRAKTEAFRDAVPEKAEELFAKIRREAEAFCGAISQEAENQKKGF